MRTQNLGIFVYKERFSDEKQNKLPSLMQLPNATYEALLLRLLLGQIDIRKSDSASYTKPLLNYCQLPFLKQVRPTYAAITNVLSTGQNKINITLKSSKTLIDKYLSKNRINTEIHKKVLFELSYFYMNQNHAPIAAFTHLYRCLEYMSYSFPLIFASKSRNYKGTFDKLKSFLSGKDENELKFFKNFVKVLFEDEFFTDRYTFNIDLLISFPIDLLDDDCKRIYQDGLFEIDPGNQTLNIDFNKMLDFFVTTRNRYFHMHIGKGLTNFEITEYDINEFFSSINPYFLNWLAYIIQKIISYGIYSLSD